MASATALELNTCAAIATLAAWVYPSDDRLRRAAATACQTLGVDYIESIAQLCEATGADTHTARQKVAGGFITRVAELVDAGEAPRLGVLASGQSTHDEEEYA